jgi:hypothetical protein
MIHERKYGRGYYRVAGVPRTVLPLLPPPGGRPLRALRRDPHRRFHPSTCPPPCCVRLPARMVRPSEIERASSIMSSRSEFTPSSLGLAAGIATILSPVRTARQRFVPLHLYCPPPHVVVSRLCPGGTNGRYLARHSGSIQDRGYGPPGIPLPGTWVNRRGATSPRR